LTRRKKTRRLHSALPDPAVQVENMITMTNASDDEMLEQAEGGANARKEGNAAVARAAERWKAAVAVSDLQVKENLVGDSNTWHCGETIEKQLSNTSGRKH